MLYFCLYHTDLVLISATIILSNPADFSPSPTSLSPNIDCYGIPVPRVWTVQRVGNNNWSLSLHISTFIACLALALQQRPSSFYIQPVSHIEELQSILAHSFLYNVETSHSLNFLSPHSTLATGTPACHRLLGNLGLLRSNIGHFRLTPICWVLIWLHRHLHFKDLHKIWHLCLQIFVIIF